MAKLGLLGLVQHVFNHHELGNIDFASPFSWQVKVQKGDEGVECAQAPQGTRGM
jgi:hypothetical protein